MLIEALRRLWSTLLGDGWLVIRHQILRWDSVDVTPYR